MQLFIKKINRALGLMLLFALLFASQAIAQQTDGTIRGKVTDTGSVALAGVTVKAVHTPSGTVYNTTTDKSGSFYLPGLRIGGPYTVQQLP
jgi:hypothetical protein